MCKPDIHPLSLTPALLQPQLSSLWLLYAWNCNRRDPSLLLVFLPNILLWKCSDTAKLKAPLGEHQYFAVWFSNREMLEKIRMPISKGKVKRCMPHANHEGPCSNSTEGVISASTNGGWDPLCIVKWKERRRYYKFCVQTDACASEYVLCFVAQSCLTLVTLGPWGLSRQEYWSGLPCPPPGDLLNPGIKPSSPALQEDSLLSEPPGKPTSVYGLC